MPMQSFTRSNLKFVVEIWLEFCCRRRRIKYIAEAGKLLSFLLTRRFGENSKLSAIVESLDKKEMWKSRSLQKVQ